MKQLDAAQLLSVTGGMKWEGFRPSTNIEDRRSKQAIARDNAWWASTHPTTAR